MNGTNVMPEQIIMPDTNVLIDHCDEAVNLDAFISNRETGQTRLILNNKDYNV
jgi:hypothetical protein